MSNKNSDTNDSRIRPNGIPHWVVSQYLLDDVKNWITAIPFDAWPQQPALRGELRPAMVNDCAWFRFGNETDPLINSIMLDVFPGRVQRNRMLSVIMPGHDIDPHSDRQPHGWMTRIHVPLVTNPNAWFVFDSTHHLAFGFAYAVDVTKRHYVHNHGTTPRVHLMFDVFERDRP